MEGNICRTWDRVQQSVQTYLDMRVWQWHWIYNWCVQYANHWDASEWRRTQQRWPVYCVRHEPGESDVWILRLVITLSLPVSNVSYPSTRAFAKFDEFFSLAYFKDMLFKLIELAEKRIGNNLCQNRGAIVHDVWICNETHLFGVFAY